MAQTFVGTSGWQYKHWREKFYNSIPMKSWLFEASRRFTSLEVDGTFYRLPKADTFAKWRETVPEDFRFAIRGNRYSTHRKKLLDPEDSIKRQAKAAASLGDKLCVVLWQTPPNFKRNEARLAAFLQSLTALWPATRHAFEFRHESWFVQSVQQILSQHRIAITISDAAHFPCWMETSTDLVYVRLHGKPYSYVSNYDRDALEQWRDRALGWNSEGRDVYIYFDNDVEVCAAFNAEELLMML